MASSMTPFVAPPISSRENRGRKVGYACSYLMFGTILFLVLSFSQNILFSASSYFYVLSFLLLIPITGVLLRRYLQ